MSGDLRARSRRRVHVVATLVSEQDPRSRAQRRIASLRANEARSFRTEYDHVFTVEPASEAADTVAWVTGILADGMAVPDEPAERFRFARQRSKPAGTIRGSSFVIEHEP